MEDDISKPRLLGLILAACGAILSASYFLLSESKLQPPDNFKQILSEMKNDNTRALPVEAGGSNVQITQAFSKSLQKAQKLHQKRVSSNIANQSIDQAVNTWIQEGNQNNNVQLSNLKALLESNPVETTRQYLNALDQSKSTTDFQNILNSLESLSFRPDYNDEIASTVIDWAHQQDWSTPNRFAVAANMYEFLNRQSTDMAQKWVNETKASLPPHSEAVEFFELQFPNND